MQARGPLMVEHRLIERMIALVRNELQLIEASHHANLAFIDTTADFIRTYADRTHHGKEEDILFGRLEPKDPVVEDRRLMAELVDDHVYGRTLTRELAEAGNRYTAGDLSALAVATTRLRTLTDFYPIHIDKEDSVFFPAC